MSSPNMPYSLVSVTHIHGKLGRTWLAGFGQVQPDIRLKKIKTFQRKIRDLHNKHSRGSISVKNLVSLIKKLSPQVSKLDFSGCLLFQGSDQNLRVTLAGYWGFQGPKILCAPFFSKKNSSHLFSFRKIFPDPFSSSKTLPIP